MRRTLRSRAPWRSLLRFASTLALLLALSGVSHAALAALGYEEPCCEEECSGSLGSKHCAPTCTTGPCARLAVAHPTLDAQALPVVVPTLLVAASSALPAPPRAPPAELPFQPPKA